MGFSAKPTELLEIDRVKRDKISVIRRYTGGGTVIVDHNTLFASIIMNNSDADTQPYPREIMTWSEGIYAPAFNATLSTDIIENTQFRLREHDYVIGDKKFGGNAQSIVKNRWVHHTSFLWDFDPLNMEYLQLPKKRPEYRQNRRHIDFLLPLCQRLSSIELLERNILQEFARHYTVDSWSEKELFAQMQQIQQQNPQFQPRTKWEEL